MIIVDGWKPLTNITKCSILDAVAFLDPFLIIISFIFHYFFYFYSIKLPRITSDEIKISATLLLYSRFFTRSGAWQISTSERFAKIVKH